jgi:hypothetical protein
MSDEIAKCGCNCFNCPTFKENIRTYEGKVHCSTGWKKYLNINLSPEKLRACDGCSLKDENRKIYYLNCMVRKCAMMNGLDNCAYCKAFPCEELCEVHSIQRIANRRDFIRRRGVEISEKDYQKFIEPYTGINHLHKIRQNLSEDDYKDFKKFSPTPKFAPIENLNEKPNSTKAIYHLLTNLAVVNNVSYAKYLTLVNKRKKLLQILWTMGSHGNICKKGNYLELDGKTFLSNNITSLYTVLKEYLLDLRIHDVICEIIPLDDKEWLTPGGGLRKAGWIIRLSFGSSLSGRKTLLKLKEYISLLNTNYHKTAFRVFSKADMKVMMQ